MMDPATFSPWIPLDTDDVYSFSEFDERKQEQVYICKSYLQVLYPVFVP